MAGLETGSFFVGYINLVWNILEAMYCVYLLIVGVVIAKTGDLNGVVEIDEKLDANESSAVGVVVSIVAGISLVFTLIALIFAIVLLVGLHKNKPGHLKAYMIFTIIYIVLMVLGLFGSAGQPFLVIIKNVAFVLINIFFYMVIKSMHVKMSGQAATTGTVYYSPDASQQRVTLDHKV